MAYILAAGRACDHARPRCASAFTAQRILCGAVRVRAERLDWVSGTDHSLTAAGSEYMVGLGAPKKSQLAARWIIEATRSP